MVKRGEPKRKLALDERNFINCDAGLKIHGFIKEEEPVYMGSNPWESTGSVPGLVCYDDAEGLYKMFYGSFDPQLNLYPAGLAVSSDGMRWHKEPRMLDDEEIAGVDGLYQGMTPCFHPEAPPGDHRFYGFSLYRGSPFTVRFLRSRDGRTWSGFEKDRVWNGPSDVINPMWDSFRKRFVSYHKLWRVQGVDMHGAPFLRYFNSFDPQKQGDGSIRVVGECLFEPGEKRVVDTLLRFGRSSDDGGGGYISDEFSMKRVVARAESDNFVDWENHRVILEPSEDMGRYEQSYGMPVFEYGGLYIGLPRHFRADSGLITSRLAVSADGIVFRTFNEDVLKTGDEGSWDCGMVLACAGPVETDGKLCFYYGGYNRDHTKDDANVRLRTGRAWIRKDGFASLTGGRVRTRPESVAGKKLCVNARGKIGVQCFDDSGRTLRSIGWEGDGTEACVYAGCELEACKTVSLEFDLQYGELFSYWFK